MIRDIVIYGDQVLRTKGKRIEEIDDEIRALAGDMLEKCTAQAGWVWPRNRWEKLSS
jgi:peptide deformylase